MARDGARGGGRGQHAGRLVHLAGEPDLWAIGDPLMGGFSYPEKKSANHRIAEGGLLGYCRWGSVLHRDSGQGLW